jgi:2'-5' RNA ligase
VVTDVPPGVGRLTAERFLFGAGWQRYRRVVARAGGRVDVELRVDDPRLDRYLTLVARLPIGIALRVTEVSSRLAAADPAQYLYPPADLHLTVMDCSALLGAGDLDQALAKLSSSLADALAGERIAPVGLCGVNVWASTAYVQAWDTTGGIRRIRRRVRADVHRPNSRNSRNSLITRVTRVSPTLLRDQLSFVNVIRFLRPVSPVLVDAVGHARTVDFGSFPVASLELVLTDKFLSASATRVVARYLLDSAERM